MSSTRCGWHENSASMRPTVRWRPGGCGSWSSQATPGRTRAAWSRSCGVRCRLRRRQIVPNVGAMPNDTAKQKIIGRGKYVELVEENGWEFVRRHASTGVVVILATTEAGELVLVE